MTEDHPAISALQSLAGEALLDHGQNRGEFLIKAADETRKEIEGKSLCVRRPAEARFRLGEEGRK
jgi:hypothetical protein